MRKVTQSVGACLYPLYPFFSVYLKRAMGVFVLCHKTETDHRWAADLYDLPFHLAFISFHFCGPAEL